MESTVLTKVVFDFCNIHAPMGAAAAAKEMFEMSLIYVLLGKLAVRATTWKDINSFTERED